MRYFMAALLVSSFFALSLSSQAQDRKLSILIIGAHPDDAEKCGGTAAKWRALGHRVTLVSLTNGDAGHWQMGGAPLAQRRMKETECAGKAIDSPYIVLDNHDGELEPTLEVRRQVIRVIREAQPDLVISPRPNDYHPDHRNTGLVVRDAAYMVTVPNIVASVPHLMKNPIFAYMSDNFTQPNPFDPDVVVSIDDTIEKKIDMYHCHVSQVYEWLPYNSGRLDDVPKDPSRRREWLGTVWKPRSSQTADKYRSKLIELYGPQKGAQVKYAEAYEVSEYGSRPSPEELKVLFPFF